MIFREEAFALLLNVGYVFKNFLKTFAGQFAIRYVYRDGEISVVGPPSTMVNYRFDITNPSGVISDTVDAIDIDNWCYLNSIENAERNNCRHITVYEGEAALLKDKKYDLVIANINRNILLNDMQSYVDCLNPKGTLLLSGFYEEDIPIIDASCVEKGLTYIKKFERNNWVSLKYAN